MPETWLNGECFYTWQSLTLCSAFSESPILGEGNGASSRLMGQKHPMPEAVVPHFRNTRNISRLPCEPMVKVIDSPFDGRSQYEQVITGEVARQHPCIVFLDPETGLEPNGRPGFEHVLDSELEYAWSKMVAGDVLAKCQHQTNRNGQPWIEPRRRQSEKALKLPRGSAKVAVGSDVAGARDVDLLLPQTRTLNMTIPGFPDQSRKEGRFNVPLLCATAAIPGGWSFLASTALRSRLSICSTLLNPTTPTGFKRKMIRC